MAKVIPLIILAIGILCFASTIIFGLEEGNKQTKCYDEYHHEIIGHQCKTNGSDIKEDFEILMFLGMAFILIGSITLTWESTL